jgi:hypothetical protein
VSFEALADDSHGGDQALVQDFFWRKALLYGFGGELADSAVVALLKCLGNLVE